MRPLTLTLVLAVLAFTGTSTALLLFDPRVNGADALRTGGLAAGSVVALYALWLNDRRRRVDEQRQELETRRQTLESERYTLEQQRQALEDRRTGNEYERAADERFARAVELLGHEADQVRIGAIHGLVGLARSNPGYTQTVLDVLCSYLRMPFNHPKWTTPNDAESIPAAATPEQERERTVRQTACKSLRTLLPGKEFVDPPIYHLDLIDAHLELVDFSDRVVGRVAAYSATFRHTVHFERTEFRGPLALSGAVFLDRLRAEDAVFLERVAAQGVTFRREVNFDRAEFLDELDLREIHCEHFVSFERARILGSVDLRRAYFERGVHLRVREPVPTFALYKTTVTAKAPSTMPHTLTIGPSESRGLGWLHSSGEPPTLAVPPSRPGARTSDYRDVRE
ncbi:hypothetical protein GIY23_21645 [Allosaccharopolyspora coralli]|uniref:Pentapeptide repeat-containing protein n=1 Tax=Allosaccharopolyspora coralli TaxID=2665642 RepID=A0A5Q3QBC7_9PSEU|nr:pentapeptide repeat-containing protein [Allosaccharopolyspora coralli]QGK71772.1 hypothetical protein GIY23_21645 [Allosaccharopolyspora coralli]